jgi:hypothetical protein
LSAPTRVEDPDAVKKPPATLLRPAAVALSPLLPKLFGQVAHPSPLALRPPSRDKGVDDGAPVKGVPVWVEPPTPAYRVVAFSASDIDPEVAVTVPSADASPALVEAWAQAQLTAHRPPPIAAAVKAWIKRKPAAAVLATYDAAQARAALKSIHVARALREAPDRLKAALAGAVGAAATGKEVTRPLQPAPPPDEEDKKAGQPASPNKQPTMPSLFTLALPWGGGSAAAAAAAVEAALTAVGELASDALASLRVPVEGEDAQVIVSADGIRGGLVIEQYFGADDEGRQAR